jgi:hypothetical protein
MAKTPITIAKNIVLAMNSIYHTHLVINVSSFYGGEGKLVRMYSVKDAYNYRGQYSNKEIFCSASGVYTCLFMVDLLSSFQGKELEDHNNEGYDNVFARKNGQAGIDYMKEVYLGESRTGEADEY